MSAILRFFLVLLLGIGCAAIAPHALLPAAALAAQTPAPISPDSFTPPATPIIPMEADAPPEEEQPIETYFLSVMSGNPRRQVTLSPPATKLTVISESGDITVRCGDRFQTYSCAPGKAVRIERPADEAVAQFWAQNSGGDSNVRLRLDVYDQETAADAPLESP